MTTLSDHLDDYLAIRRSLGYDLSTSERILRRFVELADREGTPYITTDLFLLWKKQFGTANNTTWAARLGIIRIFAIWLQAIDPRTQVPPSGLITGKIRRSQPYIYTKKQIAAIVTEAAKLPSAYGMRGWTCSTLLGLIAVTGLRISEAIGLDEKDVDLCKAVLNIKRGKAGKQRIIPISQSVADRLYAYRVERNRILGDSPSPFFLHESGKRPSDCSIRYNFAQICQQIGLRKLQTFNRHGRGPRIHDLRHTFAVRTIINWYRKDLNPDKEMIRLSTYLGHIKPEYTYWYIEAVPELLQLASRRAEQSMAGGSEQ